MEDVMKLIIEKSVDGMEATVIGRTNGFADGKELIVTSY